MTPAQFEDEKVWMGWRALAARAFDLRPSEAHALALMVRHPSRVASFEALAAFDGDGMTGSKNLTGSRGGITNRLVRLRNKLADVGCKESIETVREHDWGPTLGFRISPEGALAVELALRHACGVETRAAA